MKGYTEIEATPIGVADTVNFTISFNNICLFDNDKNMILCNNYCWLHLDVYDYDKLKGEYEEWSRVSGIPCGASI